MKKHVPDGNAEFAVLDAGCGTGRLLEIIAGTFKNAREEGIDVNSSAVQYCARRNLKHVRMGDLNTAELPAGSFDVIVSNDVLYHKEIASDEGVIVKFYAALKKNGILIMNLPAFEFLRSPHDVFIQTARRYTAPQVRRMMTACNFTVEKLSYRLSYVFVPIVIVRRIKEMFLKNIVTASDVKKTHGAVNGILYGIGLLENMLIQKGARTPFGSSVFVVGKKT